MRLPRIPEQFLRHIWQGQLFAPGRLATAEGALIAVLSPGTLNTDGGPDFRDASIRIGGVLYRGDVEMHVDDTSWHAHAHSSDPHYNRVILHVVFAADAASPPATTASGRRIPLLVLGPFLPPDMLSQSSRDFARTTPIARRVLPCAPYNESVPADLIRSWLHVLARERLEVRLRVLHERLCTLIDETRLTACEPSARYAGDPHEIPPPHTEYTRREYALRSVWEQLLYEGLMEGMGYRTNRLSFLALARSLRLTMLQRYPLEDTVAMQAMLFGAAGLLPVPRSLPGRESRDVVRTLRRRWRAIAPSLPIPLLHEADWLFFRLRPPNFPTARLASFAYCLPVLLGAGSLRTMIDLFSADSPSPAAMRRTITSLFQFVPDAYWSHHRHFRAPHSGSGIGIGRERIADLTVNTLIPFALLYARVFNDRRVERGAAALLSSLPAPRGNAVTRAVSADLLKHRLRLSSAMEHQGALQLHTFYCLAGRCSACQVGAFIGRWGVRTGDAPQPSG